MKRRTFLQAAIAVEADGKLWSMSCASFPAVDYLDPPATPAERKKLSDAPYVPLGQYLLSAAWRKNLTGFLKGPPPIFWNGVQA